MINNLKRQVLEYKSLLLAKDEELSNIKLNGKVTKFIEVESKLRTAYEELNILTEQFNILKNSYNEYLFYLFKGKKCY